MNKLRENIFAGSSEMDVCILEICNEIIIVLFLWLPVL